MESVGILFMLGISLILCTVTLAFVIHALIKYWTDDSRGPR